MHVSSKLLQFVHEDTRTGTQPGYIAGLDGLRAIAILCVLVAHGFEFGESKLSGRGEILFTTVAGHLGTVGVKLFFAISGYLICTRFAKELITTRSWAALKGFYIRRFFRIVPPVIPYLSLLVILDRTRTISLKKGEILAAIFFYSNFFTGKSWNTTHFWSLSVEEHFYLLWAPLLAFVGRRKAALVAVAATVAVSFLRPIVMAHTDDFARTLEKTPMQVDSFMFPCLFALWLLTPDGHRWLVRLAGTAWFATFAIALAIIPNVLQHWFRRLDFRSIEAALLALLVIVPGLNTRASITKFLELPVMKWVGTRSYSIYIWQMLLFVPKDLPMRQKISAFVLHCLLIFPIAQLSYRLVERPAMIIGRSYRKLTLFPVKSMTGDCRD